MSFRPASEVGFSTRSARFVAPGSVTNGEFGLFEWRMEARRPGARPHFRKTFSESFYVLEGEITLLDGDEWVTAGEGDFLYFLEIGEAKGLPPEELEAFYARHDQYDLPG